MLVNELSSEYFDWMYQLVCNNGRRLSFKKMLHHLHSIPFVWTHPLDANRADDGIELRYRFGYENNIPDVKITRWLDNKDCSVLEMMVALSLKCEDSIMSNEELGDRTSEWFWIMIKNLGLSDMSDRYYSSDVITNAIDILSTARYESNGERGLFPIRNPDHDVRDAEIWTQMNWFLSENYSE